MKNKVILTLLVAVLLATGGLLSAGALNPPAAPGPTMKTLDKLEPRIAISQNDIPKTITTPGSYYLTEDVTADGTAITVDVDNVTIDLNGFSLIGSDSAANYGIYMYARNNVEIRNGTIRNFDRAIYEYSAYTGKNHRVINVRVKSNISGGIYLKGSGHLVKNCTVTENGNSGVNQFHAIFVENGTVTGNTVSDNGDSATSAIGIYVSQGAITGNTVSGNGNSTKTLIHAIYIAYGTVTGNTVYNNGESATGTYVTGIRSSGRGTIASNSVFGNGKSAAASVTGIYVGAGCTVIGNTSSGNGDSASGTVIGINLLGNSLVDQNTAYDNGAGATGSATNMTLGVAGCVYGNNVAP